MKGGNRGLEITKEQANAYIQGVLDGDGYMDYCNPNHPRISLCTSNQQFAQIFGRTLFTLGIQPSVNHRQREINIFESNKNYHYDQHTIYVRASLTLEKAKEIENAAIDTQEKKCAYIQGLFDSDGSHFKTRGYDIISIDKAAPTIQKARDILISLGITPFIYNYSYKKTTNLKIRRKADVAKFFSLIKPKFQWGTQPEDNVPTTEKKIEQYRQWLNHADLQNITHTQGLLELAKQQFECLFPALVSDKESRS